MKDENSALKVDFEKQNEDNRMLKDENTKLKSSKVDKLPLISNSLGKSELLKRNEDLTKQIEKLTSEKVVLERSYLEKESDVQRLNKKIKSLELAIEHLQAQVSK